MFQINVKKKRRLFVTTKLINDLTKRDLTNVRETSPINFVFLTGNLPD